MGWGSSIVPLLIITPTGGFTGLFMYTPAPGAGNLLSSDTAQASTDPYGNAYFAGKTEYGTFAGEQVAINIFNGIVSFYTATTQAGPWTKQSSIGIDNAGDLTIATTGTLVLTGGSGAAHPTDIQLPSGAAAFLVNGDDDNTYNFGKLVMDNGAAGDTTISSTTPTVIGSATVAARRYLVTMRAILTMGTVGAPAALGLVASTGGTINYCRIQFKTFIDSNATQSVIGTLSQNTLVRYPTPSLTASTSYIVEADGLVSFSAAGTVQFQAAEGTSGDSWTLVHPSFLKLEPIT
jgi:hypothetical protein